MMVKRRSGAVLAKMSRLDLLLKSNRDLTRSALARELGVCKRSVSRYLAYMKSMLDPPVTVTPGAPDHDPSAPIPAGRADLGEEPSRNGQWVDQPGDLLRPLMDEVHEGLCQRRKMLIRAPEIRMDPFEFHPYFLSRMAGEVRLFGFIAGLGQISDFPVSALAEARCLPDSFEDNLATEPKIRHGRGWIPSGTRHAVCLRFQPNCRWALGLKICAGQSVEESEEHILIRFTTDDLGQVQRFAEALRTCVTVEEPAVLRSRLRSYLTGDGPSYSPLPHVFDRAPSSR